MQGPLRGLHQDLYTIFSQGLAEDLDQDLPARTPTKKLPRASRKSFHTSNSLQDPHARTSERGSYQDLYKVF